MGEGQGERANTQNNTKNKERYNMTKGEREKNDILRKKRREKG